MSDQRDSSEGSGETPETPVEPANPVTDAAAPPTESAAAPLPSEAAPPSAAPIEAAPLSAAPPSEAAPPSAKPPSEAKPPPVSKKPAQPFFHGALRPLAVLGPVALCLLLLERAMGLVFDADAPSLRVKDLYALYGAHAILAAISSVGALLVAGFVRLLARVWPRKPVEGADASFVPYRALFGGLFAAGLAAYPANLVGADLVQGEWIQKQGYTTPLHIAVTVALSGAVGVMVAISLADFARRTSRGRTVFVIGAGVAALVLSLADAVVLPGLYPLAHLSLYVMSGIAVAAALVRLLRVRWFYALGSTVLSVATIAFALVVWWRMDVVSRASVSQSSFVARQLLPVFSPPHEDDSLQQLLATMNVSEGELEVVPHDAAATQKLTGGRTDYSVVLLLVDTLRADALLDWRKPGGSSEAGDTPFLDEFLKGSYRFKYAYSHASKTRKSVPPLFSSLETHEDPEKIGDPITLRLADLGRKPIAVVPQYFILPITDGQPTGRSSHNLLEGFEHIGFYEEDKQTKLNGLVDTALAENDKRPIFGWVHFYNMHSPYYADRHTTAADGSQRDRYRMALRALDKQVAQTVASIEGAMGAGNTIYVLTADHGENLGDNRSTGHGGTVLEEETRVPLTIHVPGTPGGLVDRTVGNIDIVPTVMDLVGESPDDSMRGRSLVPLMADPETTWNRSYLLGNGSLSTHGVVRGRQKLIYATKTKLFTRYDLSSDPEETRSLFIDGPQDRVLLADLYRHHPALGQAQLKSENNRKLLERRLTEVDAKEPGSAVTLLLKLTAFAPTPLAVKETERIFREAEREDLRLLTAKHLAVASPKAAQALLSKHLASLSPKDAANFAELLGRQGQPAFAEKDIAGRLLSIAAADGGGPSEELQQWAHLIRGWPKDVDTWAQSLTRHLEHAESLDERTLRLLLQGATRLKGKGKAENRAMLARALIPIVDSDDAELARNAVIALGLVGDPKEHAEVLRSRALDTTRPARVRQAMLRALVSIEGKEATMLIVELGNDPLLTLDAVQALGDLRDARAVPFLKEVQRSHSFYYTRDNAQLSLDKISGKKSKGASKKKKK